MTPAPYTEDSQQRAEIMLLCYNYEQLKEIFR